MGDKNHDLELEWPSFQNIEDNRISYSPDRETEDIFTDFIPATEKHLRNKKRKPKKPKAKSLRLISESDINGKSEPCLRDRFRCIIISVLVVCIVVIVAVCIFLGVYFGVIVKKPHDPQTGQSQAEQTESTPVPPYTSTNPTKLPHVVSQTLLSSSTSIASSLAQSTSTSTTSTSTTSSTTSTTTSTTTTTTTTTTTPPPTEPPVLEYTGSDADKKRVIDTAKKCEDTFILTTDGLTNEEKCGLYREMLLCVYISLVSDQLYVPIDVLIRSVETNWYQIFPVWIEINTDLCRDEDGGLTINNISSLPRELKDLCSSADAILLQAKDECKIVRVEGANLSGETDIDKCRLLWGTQGCVAENLDCPFETIREAVNIYADRLLEPMQLGSVNTTVCQDQYLEISVQSPCVMMLYTYMLPIYYTCARVIQEGSKIAEALPEYSCSLFETFFECSYSRIPEVTCNKGKEGLRQVAYDMALVASKVNKATPFTNITTCIDKPMLSTYICKDTKKLLAVLDTHCYYEFRSAVPSKLCQTLKEYIYTCGPTYLMELGTSCAKVDIEQAVINEDDLIYANYGINVKDKLKECQDTPPAR